MTEDESILYHIYCDSQKIGHLSYPKERTYDKSFDAKDNLKVFMSENNKRVKVSLGIQQLVFTFQEELQKGNVEIYEGKWKYDEKTGGREELTLFKSFDLSKMIRNKWREIS
jgi:hypothetical protein